MLRFSLRICYVLFVSTIITNRVKRYFDKYPVCGDVTSTGWAIAKNYGYVTDARARAYAMAIMELVEQNFLEITYEPDYSVRVLSNQQ